MMNEQGTGFKYAEIMKDVGVEKNGCLPKVIILHLT